MVKVDVTYTGGLHCDAEHAPSQSKISTDAPTDNKGKGEAFSPTDLVATAAATCMATTMAIVARRHGLDLTGVEVSIEKVMSQDGPRRIVSLASEIWMPVPSTHPHRTLLENTARACPVHQSIHPDIQRPITFHWKGE
jgi:uncharacterized OsmC-like protein